MKVWGLTGGIGMGKSTAAAAFRRARVPVFDADAEVHRLQGRGGRAVAAIEAAFPGVVVDGAVDRGRLRAAAFREPGRSGCWSGSCIRWCGRRSGRSWRGRGGRGGG